MSSFRKVHASGRWDRPLRSLRDSLDLFATELGATVVTGTELDQRHRRDTVTEWARANHWSATVPPAPHPFTDDAYVAWSAARWARVYVEHSVVCRVPFKMGGGATAAQQYAVYAVLRDKLNGEPVLFTTTHTPSGVEMGDHWRGGLTAARVRAWLAAQRGWRKRSNELAERFGCVAVVQSADWNIDLHRRAWRAVLRTTYPARRLTWLGRMPTGGSHAGGRLIDGTLIRGRIKCTRARLLTAHRYRLASDHLPYVEDFTLGGAK